MIIKLIAGTTIIQWIYCCSCYKFYDHISLMETLIDQRVPTFLKRKKCDQNFPFVVDALKHDLRKLFKELPSRSIVLSVK